MLGGCGVLLDPKFFNGDIFQLRECMPLDEFATRTTKPAYRQAFFWKRIDFDLGQGNRFIHIKIDNRY